MRECVVTVLTVEGEIYFNSCCACNTKVDLIPDTNRGWCKKCRACTSSPNKRYRLSLKVSESSTPVHITIFGRNANELFGCTAYEFFRKVCELDLTDDQVKTAVEKSLLSEVLKVSRQKDGGVSNACFAVPSSATCVVDNLQRLDASDPSYTLSRIHRKMKLQHSITPHNKTPAVSRSRHMVNSTPLFSQSAHVALNDCEQLSPIWPAKDTGPAKDTEPAKMDSVALLLEQLMNSPPDSPTSSPDLPKSNHWSSENIKKASSTSKVDIASSTSKDYKASSKAQLSSLMRNGSHQENNNSSTSESSYSVLDIRRGKRRRCRVQCVVVDPPTQNTVTSSNMSGNIRPPDLLERLRISSSEEEEAGENYEGRLGVSEAGVEKVKSICSKRIEERNVGKFQDDFQQIVDGENSEIICGSSHSFDNFDSHMRDAIKPQNIGNMSKEVSADSLENEIEDLETLPQSGSSLSIDTFKTQPMIYIEPDVIADLMRSDDSLFDDDQDDQNTSVIPETQDFDSFEVDDIPELEKITNGEHLQKPAESSCKSSDRNSLEPLESDNSTSQLYQPDDYNVSSFSFDSQMTFNSSPHPSTSTMGAASQTGTQNTSQIETQNSSDEDLFGGPQPPSPDQMVRSKRKSRDEDFEWSMLSQMSSQEISKHFDFRLSETDEETSDCSAELF